MLTTKDLETIKKSGKFYALDFVNEEVIEVEVEDVESLAITEKGLIVDGQREITPIEQLFATEEEAQEDLESFCEEFFICKECEEVCRLRDLSFTDKTCCDCHNRLVREFDEDLRDRNMDYWRGKI